MSGNQNTILERAQFLQSQVSDVAQRYGRQASEIKISAISKFFSSQDVLAAYNAGFRYFGESRVQELVTKHQELAQLADLKWQFIGHLQTNKINAVLSKISLLQSLDSWRLAQELDRKLGAIGKELDVLVQVNITNDEAKYGLDTTEVPQFLDDVATLENLNIKGLMTIGKRSQDPREIEAGFADLRALQEKLRPNVSPNIDLSELSMGMSQDYALAIKHGATLIRVGSYLFGQRSY